MITEDKVNDKIALKKETIGTAICELQDLINGYEPDLEKAVKLEEHAALASIIAKATQITILVNELGLLKNVAKTPKKKKA
jgi:hypothetical protein